MNVQEILSRCDHTLLSTTATWEEIRAVCDDGMKYGCASVCIPASFVKCATIPRQPSALWRLTR